MRGLCSTFVNRSNVCIPSATRYAAGNVIEKRAAVAMPDFRR